MYTEKVLPAGGVPPAGSTFYLFVGSGISY
jgi:hypothetical protein